MVGGCLYWDAQLDDCRMVMENILASVQAGAHVQNYTRVTALAKQGDMVTGVYIQNQNEPRQIRAKFVVNATGAWSNQITQGNGLESAPVYPTRGAHLVIPNIHPTHALILTAPQDGRIFFLIPWKGYSLLGTTDIPYDGDPDRVTCTPEEINYLLKAINFYFPDEMIEPQQVIATYAGLRPLVNSLKKNASSVRRDHLIQMTAPGLVTVLGGKFTTHREMAQEVVDKIVKEYAHWSSLAPCRTATTPLPGGEKFSLNLQQHAHEYGIETVQLQHIVNTYGSASTPILQLLKNYPEERKQVCIFHPHLYAEIKHVIQNEKAQTLSDWFTRRTSIAYSHCGGKVCAENTAKKFGELLGWGPERQQQEITQWLSQSQKR
jgi:glycerol-3-phosphate dehydrogenase